MPAPDPHRLAALIVELRRSLRRSAGPSTTASETTSVKSERARDGSSRQARPLRPTEEEILRYVAAHPGRGTSGIAAALHLRANTVSGLCSALTRQGHLLREPDPADGRAARFFLSPGAAARRAEKMGHRSDRLAQALADLVPDQQEQIAAALPALEALADLLDAESQDRTRP